MSDVPQALRMVADDLILVDEFKVELGAGAKIGEVAGTGGPDPSFFITMSGRINKSTERRTVHVALKAELGYQLGDHIMTRMEEFIELMRKQGEQ